MEYRFLVLMINCDTKLYKGIFWFIDLEDMEHNDLYFQIPCDKYGNSNLTQYEIDVISKDGKSLNHKKLWETLSTQKTNKKKFDYYPRGRVEISNGVAKIFIHPVLCEYKEKIIEFCKKRFNLLIINGIKSIKVIFDGSNHYMPKMFKS